jgi:hypothetical protein
MTVTKKKNDVPNKLNEHNGTAVRGKGYGERRGGCCLFFWLGSPSLRTSKSPPPFLTIEGGVVWETKGKDPADGEAKEQEEGEGKEKARVGTPPGLGMQSSKLDLKSELRAPSP